MKRASSGTRTQHISSLAQAEGAGFRLNRFSKHRVQAPAPDSNRLVCLESGGHCGVEACFASAQAVSCRNAELLCPPPVSSGWTDTVQESISGFPLGPEAQMDSQILPHHHHQRLIREQVSGSNHPQTAHCCSVGGLHFKEHPGIHLRMVDGLPALSPHRHFGRIL